MRIHKMIHTGCLVIYSQTIKTCSLKVSIIQIRHRLSFAVALKNIVIFVWSVVERLKSSPSHSDPKN